MYLAAFIFSTLLVLELTVATANKHSTDTEATVQRKPEMGETYERPQPPSAEDVPLRETSRSEVPIVNATSSTDLKYASEGVESEENPEIEIYLTRCSICHVYFRYNRKFEEHCKITHGVVRPYECLACFSKFTKKCSLVLHKRSVHSNEREVCGEQFAALKDFEERAEDAAGDVDILRYPGRYARRAKKTVFDILTCKNCRQKFNRSDALEKHKGECVNKIRAYRSKSKLRRHSHSAHYDENEGSSSKIAARGCLYECVICGVECKGVTALQKHGRIEHPDEKLFRCDSCQEGFTRRNTLYRHERDLHGDPDMRCSHCARCYSRKDLLRNHEIRCGTRVRKRMEEGWWFCKPCQKNFTGKVKIEYHKWSHKFYESCEHCGERFHKVNNLNGLAEHTKKRHPLQGNINALLKTLDVARALKEEEYIAGKMEDTESRVKEETFIKIEKNPFV